MLEFKNISNDRIKDCFAATYAKFPTLQDHRILLEQLPLKNYTMRAQPIVNSRFWRRSRRDYRVQISDHLQLRNYVRIEELSTEELQGWFAHELGHVMDYQRRSVLSLIRFLFSYLLIPNYRMGAERRADLFAIEHGFGTELMATKNFILDKSTLPERYKKRIRRYYLSPTELEELLVQQSEQLLATHE